MAKTIQTKKSTTDRKVAIEELRGKVREAAEHEKDLNVEASAIAGKIKAASQRAFSEKLEAAKEAQAGDVLLTVASEDEVNALQDRARDLPHYRVAAAIRRAELERQLHVLEEQLHSEAIPAVKDALAKANANFEQAQAEQQAALVAYSGAERRQDEARRLRRLAEDRIRDLEEAYTDA